MFKYDFTYRQRIHLTFSQSSMLEYFYERIKHPLPDQKDKLGKLTGLSKRELVVSLFFFKFM